MSILPINPKKLIVDLNDFTEKKLIGSPGAFGTIYTAEVKHTKEKVLIKQPQYEASCRYVNALITEYNILLDISHPSFPPVIGFYHPENSDEYGLIMPFYQNGSLENLLYNSSENIKPNSKIQIIYGIADALEYLHSKDYTHRDLKPDNILLDNNKRPIIIDFGISKEHVQSMHTKIGTFHYVAPELYQEGSYNEKADVYSFGLIVNEVYSRRKEFTDLANENIMMKKLNGEVHANNSVPRFFRDTIDRCLSVRPDERPSFREIRSILKDYINDLDDDETLQNYIKDLNFGRKQKLFYNIPKQIIKLPDDPSEWKEDIEAPIDWDLFHKIFPSEDKKVLLIMTIGNHESGKSTFIRTITGNIGFVKGTGIKSTTYGILIDGPYNKTQLLDQIFDDDYKEKFQDINIDDDTDIYFMDSQGIGDDEYKKLEKILEKIYSIFCTVSTICISLPNINSQNDELEKVFKIMRRTQFIFSKPNSFTKLIMLIKGYEAFTTLTDTDFQSLDDFNNHFKIDYWQKNQNTSEFYFKNSMMVAPIGHNGLQRTKYIHSVWYSLYLILSKIESNKLTTKKSVVDKINYLAKFLFGENFINLKSQVRDSPDKEKLSAYTSNPLFSKVQKPVSDILKCCLSISFLCTEFVSEILEKSLSVKKEELENLYNEIILIYNTMFSVYFPFFISDFDITLSDFWQYSNEIYKDIHSYFKKNSNDYKIHMKLENNAVKARWYLAGATIAASAPISFIPIAGWIAGPAIPWLTGIGYNLYFRIQRHIRNKKIGTLVPTIFPYIWEKNILSIKPTQYDMNSIKQIGSQKDQLIIFLEQNNNDSSLIFSSLTGIQLKNDDNSTANVSLLFKKVPIKSFMERYKRYGKIHQSKLSNTNVHILYLKGYSQSKIDEICQKQAISPIFVSSIIDGQSLQVVAPANCSFNLFYLSTKDFMYYFVDKVTFCFSLNDPNSIIVKRELNLERANIIFINADDFNFDKYGPLVQAQLKYGSRLILQDPSITE